MKSIKFLLLTLLGFQTLLAQTGYNLKFNIKGLKEGGKVQLAFYQGEKKLLEDTTLVKGGKFEFKGATSLQRGLYLVALPESGYFDMVISDDQEFEVEGDTSNFVKSIKFKGCQENTDFYTYLQTVTPIQQKFSEQNKKYSSDSCSKIENKNSTNCKTCYDAIVGYQDQLKKLMNDYVIKNPNYLSSKMFKSTIDVEVPTFEEIKEETVRQKTRYNYFKAHYFDNIDIAETGLVRTPILEGKINYFIDELTYKQCDSVKKSTDYIMSKKMEKPMYKYLLGHITSKFEKSNIMCFDCVSLHMFENYYLKDTVKVDWVSKETRQKIREEVWKTEHNQCGKKVYPLAMKDTTGKVHDIFKVDAEYTLVYFWSATCGHCKKTTPKLFEMYNRLKDEYDFEVYSVHIDKNRDEYDKYMKEHKFTWINTIDTGGDQAYRTAYNVFSTPTIYLLNNKKEIIAKKVDISTIEKIITGKEGPIEDESHEGHDH